MRTMGTMGKGWEQDFPDSIFLHGFDFEAFAYTSIKNMIKFKMPVTKLVPWIISHFYRSHFFFFFLKFWCEESSFQAWSIDWVCGLPLAPFLLYLVPVIIHSLIHQTVIFCCVPGIILAIGLHPGKHNTNLPSSWNLYSCCRGGGMRINIHQ